MRRTSNRCLLLFALALVACSNDTRLVDPAVARTGTPAPGPISAAIAPAGIPAPPSGFSLYWADDFTGPAGAGVDTTEWIYDVGQGRTFGTDEIETMTNSTDNVYQDGAGTLVIKAIKKHASWYSGRIESKRDDFGAAAGGVVRMQAAIQQPDSFLTAANGLGYWPAFWMLGSTFRTGTSWPTSGEIDIMEDVNAQSVVYSTLHCGIAPGGPCNEYTGIGSGPDTCAGCQTGYHTYAVEIDRSVSPEQIRYYLDGAVHFTVDASQVDATTWAEAVDHPFFIIFDLAMGGSFPNAICNCSSPNRSTASGGAMRIAYVAVYNKP